MGNANASKKKNAPARVNGYLSQVAGKTLTEEDIKELRESFRLFDKDGDGKITAEEITKVLASININIAESDVKLMIREVDSDGNGTIEFEEFCAMMTDYLQQPLTEEDIVGAFKIFDRDSDGCITKDELKTVLDSLAIPCNQKSLESLLKAADTNGDGSIDYKEFASQLMKIAPK